MNGFLSTTAMPPLYLEIPQVHGSDSEQSRGELIFHVNGYVRDVRFSNTRGSLAFAPWLPIVSPTTQYRCPWNFRGDASRTSKDVWAQARLVDDAGEEHVATVSAAEGPRTGGLACFPPEGVYEPRTSAYLILHDFAEGVHQWASYDDLRGNAFWPMYWHPDGYAWNSHFERGPDGGEDPVTCLAMHNYFRWFDSRLDYANIDGLTVHIEAAFEGDLKGATAHLFALMSDDVGGEPLPSSGRYHQMEPYRQVQLGVGDSFATTHFTVPTEAGWVDYYRRRGTLRDGTPPDLRFVDGFGIAFHGFERDALPEGILKVRRFDFRF